MKILVTGGSGFLGKALVYKLLENNHIVRILCRKNVPDLEEAGVEIIKADISNYEDVETACKNIETVFHVAAKTGIELSYPEFHETNVKGTENIIRACLKNNVKRLIYTSTPSVVFGKSEIIKADESCQFPSSYLCPYQKTKAIAEKIVTQANGKNGLLTVSLRPHLIYGPLDTNLIPRLIERVRKNQLVQIGDGQNTVDLTYIDNAVHAHINAMEFLEKNPKIPGSSYFISDDSPVNLWKWINNFLIKINLCPVKRKINYKLAYLAGFILEIIWITFKIKKEPAMTRFLASQLALSHYFNINNAKQDFKYKPVVSPDEALEKLISHYRQ